MFTECVLAYVEKKAITEMLQYLSDNFTNLVVVDYEMFNGNDPFGKVMVRNFEARGCSLAGISFFDSLKGIREQYETIFSKEDFTQNFEIYDMNDVSKLCIDQTEYQRYQKSKKK